MIIAERTARTALEQLRTAERLLIEKLQLEIARLKRGKRGASSERSARLEQLELSLEDLLEALVVAEVAVAAVDPVQVEGFERRRPARRPLPEHLPRHRVVLPNPTACPCCGGSKLGEIDPGEAALDRRARRQTLRRGRRKSPELADLKRAPMASNVVKDIDAIFAAERAINGMPPGQRLDIRRRTIRPLVAALEVRLRSDRAKLLPKSATANAINELLPWNWKPIIAAEDEA
jgi:hypothetical protein